MIIMFVRIYILISQVGFNWHVGLWWCSTYNTPHFFALRISFFFLWGCMNFIGRRLDEDRGGIWGIPGALERNYYWCIGVDSVNLISPVQRITKVYVRNYEVIPQTSINTVPGWSIIIVYVGINLTSECTTRALNTLTQELHPWLI